LLNVALRFFAWLMSASSSLTDNRVTSIDMASSLVRIKQLCQRNTANATRHDS
jgi:hypothetical protein